VVSVRLHPLADRVYDAVDGGLRGRDQLAHLDLLWSRELPVLAALLKTGPSQKRCQGRQPSRRSRREGADDVRAQRIT
jgi:hypothetical protein